MTALNTTKNTDTAPAEAFTIDTEQKAAWVLRKIRTIQDEREAIKAATAERLEQLDADENSLMARFAEPLRVWAEGEAERRRRKTVTLPLAGASLTFRSVAASVVVQDKKTAAEVAVSLGYTKPATADLTAYKDAAVEALEKCGELLPGCAISEARESFGISFPKKGDKTTTAE